MKKYGLLIGCLVMQVLMAAAQAVDTTYIRPFSKPNTLEVYSGLYNINFDFSDRYFQKNDFQLRVNRSATLGADLTYKWLYVQYAFNLPGTMLDNQAQFNYRQLKVRLGNRKWIVQPFYQFYNGLLIPEGKHRGFEIFRGITFESAGAEVMYYVHSRQFSPKAAYAFSEQQRRSSGSAFVTATGLWHAIRWPVPSPDLIEDPGTFTLLSRNPAWVSLLLKGGYAYNLVIHNWLIAPSASIGVGGLKETQVKGMAIRSVTQLQGNLNAGYNGSNWYTYLSGSWTNLNTKLLIKDMQRVSWTLTATAGFRFRSSRKKMLSIL
ncbi:hypothetical protein BWI93_02625 [Siphonobacter sp. BAB-5385]|uniref:DUF4421 family protein n=1 Tax=Siphonobacter sp. BAB-5385 TaxID=1864822 RepID=UPI000B9E9CEE|nr:DUF4421 family protein [Siphonobacter sp. BAB-5385]OZI09779.1 hypothetical protein BWI93_02625 [Siphonobacter sp. BAB-5385]